MLPPRLPYAVPIRSRAFAEPGPHLIEAMVPPML